MKLKSIFAAVTLALLPQMLMAQWRVGVNAGATYNMYSIDKQYMTDYKYDGVWSFTTGVTGQYNFKDWFGLRAGLNVMQRNYRHTRSQMSENLDMKYKNTYLMLPVTANFSFGGKTLRGFTNLGIYAGYWMTSYRSGRDFNSFGGIVYEFSEKVPFYSDRDRRWDFGYTGSVGMEYHFAKHWVAQAEVLCYYSAISTVKNMEYYKDYRYNTTIGIQAGVSYKF